MSAPETPESEPHGPYVRARVPVTGLTEAAAAARMRTALRRMEGVVRVEVDSGLLFVTVTFDPGRAGLLAITQELDSLGFPAADVVISLSVRGMTSSACVARVRAALESVPGVIEAHVNPVLNRADVRMIGPDRPAEALTRAVREAGYGAVPLGEHEAVADLESPSAYGTGAAASRSESLLLGLTGAMTVPLLLNLAARILSGVPLFSNAWAFVLCSVVLGVGGARYAYGAWQGILDSRATMDHLIVLGAASSYLYSLIAWIMGGHHPLYFETAAAIVFLVRFGKWLEAMVKHGTTRAIRSLMKLRAKSARVVVGGTVTSKPIRQVRVGDVVMVKPYERIPVDGVIVRGETAVDSSMITGAGLPEDVGVGDPVTGGTMNGSGTILVTAARIESDATLARIIALVEEAQGRKVPLQRFIDRTTTLFVPGVLGFAGFTLFAWLVLGHPFSEAINAAVSVLVVACPCALGLAAPAALVAGTGAAAKAGILIRDIDSLEKAFHVNTLIFDKTGTLTEGRPQVLGAEALDGDVPRLLLLAASAQQGSEHPLGRSILEFAAGYGIAPASLKAFEARPGRGVAADVEGARVLIGNPALMREAHVDMAVGDWIAPLLSREGRSPVWVACDGRLIGGLSVSDPVRPDAAEAVAALTKAGIACAVVSGDSAAAVEGVARELRIKNVWAAALPRTKIRVISRLQRLGRSVAMVGDGVNDAPALAAADLGIAVGSASDAALQTADITLLRSDMRAVAGALAISRETWRVIRQNLALAFVYNLVALPVAAFGLLSPAVAGAAMAAGSLSVVLNALRLSRWTSAPAGTDDAKGDKPHPV